MVMPTPTLTVSPTAAPTLTPMATPTPAAIPIPTPKPTGFEVLFSVVGLIAVAYLVLRRKRK